MEALASKCLDGLISNFSVAVCRNIGQLSTKNTIYLTIWPPSAAIKSKQRFWTPKSARILSAAITRTPLLPAGVRIEPPAGIRVPCDDFHSGVG